MKWATTILSLSSLIVSIVSFIYRRHIGVVDTVEIFRRKKDNGEWKRLSRQPQHL